MKQKGSDRQYGKYGVRHRFNSTVRKFGNKICPYRTKFVARDKGLGDLLTTDVNFRKAGATAGAVSPWVACYGIFNLAIPGDSSSLVDVMGATLIYGATWQFSTPTSVILGRAGYRLGEKLDSKLEYMDFPREIFNTLNSRKNNRQKQK